MKEWLENNDYNQRYHFIKFFVGGLQASEYACRHLDACGKHSVFSTIRSDGERMYFIGTHDGPVCLDHEVHSNLEEVSDDYIMICRAKSVAEKYVVRNWAEWYRNYCDDYKA